MSTTRTLHTVGSLALWLLVAGCGPTLVPAASALPEDDAGNALRGLLAKGQRVVLREAAACDATFAADLRELTAGGKKLADSPWAKAPSLWQIDRAVVALKDDTGGGFLALQLRDQAGAGTWFRIAGGKQLVCLEKAGDDVVLAQQSAGRKVVFAPGQPACQRLEARGSGATSALLDGDPAAVLAVDGLVAVDGIRPWVGLQRDTIRVPFDVLRDCFTDPKPQQPVAGPTALAHVPLGRCTRSDDGGQEHLECPSSLGVWEGTSSQSALAFRLVRRTLGPVHFTGGRPVDGRRYARTVVAVSTGRPQNERARELYAAMEASVAATLAQGDGSIRVAASSDPKVTYRIKADADDVRIGDLVRRQVEQTSRYQDGERDVPNPRHAEAQQAVQRAVAGVDKAQADYDKARADYEQAKVAAAVAKAAADKACEACDNISNPMGKVACKSGCAAGGAVIQAIPQEPTTAGVESAKRELQTARDTFAATPQTVKEPIMKPWTYQKTIFSRSVATTLHVLFEPKGAPPRKIDVPLTQGWEDHEIQADPRHNVTGHEPDRGPLNRPDSLVPWLARKANEAVAKRIRAALDQALIDDALKALAGGEPPKPGFEAVDAKAFEVAGPRLLRHLQRGRVTLGAGGAAPMPSEASVIAPGECLLAVAVAEDAGGTSADLRLTSADGGFGDLRGKRFASVEVCAGELPAKKDTVSLDLRSTAGGEVRWGLYRTAGEPKKAGP